MLYIAVSISASTSRRARKDKHFTLGGRQSDFNGRLRQYPHMWRRRCTACAERRIAEQMRKKNVRQASLKRDRKSVVKGKRVLVRVDIGGRGIIKQKQKE